MKQIRDVLKNLNLRPRHYQKVGKVVVVETSEGKFALKDKEMDKKIENYLVARNFNYFPKNISLDRDDYEIMEYIEEFDIPTEQKLNEMIEVVGLLHNKTTYYKEVSEGDFKKLYEDIKNNIIHLNGYYNDLIEIIETKVFMSPSEYLIARNITKIFSALNYCENELDAWWEMVKDKRKHRVVVLHNNLSLDHFLLGSEPYLISWGKSKIDIPIFDIYKLYKKVGLDYDFGEVLKKYEYSYSLLDDERKLFFILISMPHKIVLTQNEWEDCIRITADIDFLYKTEKLLDPYYKEI